MCTVVCRWRPEEAYPVQMLALRDERASRAFDPPGEWWPHLPGVVGGRDRTAGGSWCVTDVARGVVAVVLNWPGRMAADPGAASRGILPLAAAEHGERWAEHVAPAGMAGFHLVLAGPAGLTWWWWDGEELRREELRPGLSMFRPTGPTPDADVDPRLHGRAHLDDPAAPTEDVWGDWLPVVRRSRPSDDPARGFLVRHDLGDGDSYETVFGQFLAVRPGGLRLDVLDRPVRHQQDPWTVAHLP